eukprot:jgi/Galph1/2801/GphlegSOOS_G1467.1
MAETCLFIESEDRKNSQQEDPSALTRKLTPKRLRTPEELEAGLLRADENRTRLFSDQIRRCAEEVKKALEVAKSAREELELTLEAKRGLIEKQLKDAELRRQVYLEACRRNAREHYEKVREVATAQTKLRKTDTLRLCAHIQTQLWNADSRRCRRLAMRARRASNLALSKSSPPVSRNSSGCQSEIAAKFEMEHNAATTIQFFWRFLHVQKSFKKLGLSLDDCIRDGFEWTQRKIQRYEAIQAAGMTLRMFHPNAYTLSSKETRRFAKLFLTSFVIAAHSDHVLDHPEHGLEKSIVNAARDMLIFLLDTKKDPVSCAVKARAVWTKYRVLFDEWERKDRERLINGIIMDYTGMETLKKSVQDEEANNVKGGAEATYKPNSLFTKSAKSSTVWLSQIDKRQRKLKEALLKIGGEESVRKLEEAVADLRHPTTHVTDDNNGHNTKDCENKDTAEDSHEVDAQHLLNDVYAHEMMIDMDAFLQKLQSPSSYKQMLKMARHSFLEDFQRSLKKALEKEDEYHMIRERFKDLIWNLKRKLLSILPQKTDHFIDEIYSKLELSFDEELITQTLNHDAFSADDARVLFKVVVNILKAVESPDMDETLNCRFEGWMSLIDNTEKYIREEGLSGPRKTMVLIGTLFSVICEVLDFMENVERSIVLAKITILAPLVQEYGAEWEHKRFEHKIDIGVFNQSLPVTVNWLKESLQFFCGQYSTLNIQAVERKEKAAVENVVKAAFVRLIDSPCSLSEKEIPEVLRLDHERIFNLQNDLQRLSLLSALDLISRRFVKEKAGLNVRCDLTEVNEILQDANPTFTLIERGFLSSISQALEVLDSEEELTLTAEDNNFLSSMITRAARLEDPIFSILKRRIMDLLYKHFLLNPTNAGDDYQLQSLGLAAIVKDFHQMMKNIDKVVNHLLKVHFDRLMNIMGDTSRDM